MSIIVISFLIKSGKEMILISKFQWDEYEYLVIMNIEKVNVEYISIMGLLKTKIEYDSPFPPLSEML